MRPSTEDDRLTEHLDKAAKVMNIRLIDHVILTDGKFYSYADEGKYRKSFANNERYGCRYPFKNRREDYSYVETVYDPEIPVNIYDLGLIYKIDLQDDGEVVLDMTLTAPNCPAVDFIMEDVRQKVDSGKELLHRSELGF